MDIKYIRLKSSIANENEISKIRNAYFEELSSKYNIRFIESTFGELSPVIFLIETGGTEELFKQYSDRISTPCYLLTTGLNNSLPASIEIQTYMKQIGKECEIVHGDYEEIAQKLFKLCDLHQHVKSLTNQRLGVVGRPSDWLIASITNYSLIKDKCGIDLIDISSTEFEDEIRKKEYTPTARTIELKEKWNNKDEIEFAFGIYGALTRLIKKYHLDGLTVRCFDLLSKFHNTTCLALALLNEDGYTATCEGDVPSMITMHYVLKELKLKSFQSNPSAIDVNSNSVIFAHCTIPFDMLTSYKLMTHFESGIGIAVRGELALGECTILRFNKDLTKAFVSRGEILENQDTELRCRTQIKVKLDKDVKYFFTKPCGNHHMIIYGNHVKEIEDFCNSINCKLS